uniref:Reverse transcriptase domain-containing protein n=1 Tax=Tanacetum cinerariifolium TaxID=118510 RepID=A0A699I3W1_TANCI|nr:reverse transcriptase domain-containing protein [Tanacetum cinerariifolium]
MADQRTMAELLRAPTERYNDLLRACPRHSFTELHQLDTFYNALNLADQDSLNAAAGEIAKLTHAVNQQTSAMTTAMTAMLKQFQATPPPASVKAFEETCVTCGGAHPYYQSGSLPSNTVANPKGELKAITTRSGIVPDGPIVPTPPKSINPEVDERVEETFTDLDLAEYTIKVPPPPIQKYKPPSQREYVEKLQELANTPLKENCSAIILKKLPEKLRDPWKFLIPCGFSELKCKALADLGASINLMPLSVWKKLGLPEFIFTCMTLELANRAICTPAGIARDVFISVGKFTFPTDFVIVNYKSDPRVPLILGRPFLWTARALINKESINLINVFNNSSDDFLEDVYSNQPSGNPTFSSHLELTLPKFNDDIFDLEGSNVLSEKLLDLNSTKDLHPHLHDSQLSGSTTYSIPLLKEFADELAFPLKYDDDLQFDIEFDLKEIEFMLYQDIDSNIKDSIDQSDLANLADNVVEFMPEMFTDEHALDYSSPLIFDEYDDDFLEVKFDAENVYDDPFDSKGEKIKESKLLIDELDLPCDFLLSEYDSLVSQDFSSIPRNVKTHTEGFYLQSSFPQLQLGNLVSKSNRANVYLMAYLINGLRFT